MRNSSELVRKQYRISGEPVKEQNKKLAGFKEQKLTLKEQYQVSSNINEPAKEQHQVSSDSKKTIMEQCTLYCGWAVSWVCGPTRYWSSTVPL